ncbi:MAG TPA: SAM-dependent methyltransferase [Chloroflexus aurantiacus]|jgi:hypothetical protein|uniref:Methyltransferase type 11 n=1 Tax=Chloroflexus aurantiacus (strain ATCC 29366 / DSM 635 / J-10-fl) TaxID=324602 RepID=A9WAC8_CHLAA|nr:MULTISPECIES: class I SAM-dependent methyltransferase [Chloroflexus]ABY34687.1 Methyltransferase type 11 [Chloroflexus aurantiacus J-10-fl]RMG52671.1 MAG: SAM-dependent methyltransferase [Chloroflexota bacterium]HBW67353.1 SAM-dependent methyltransferase [Chloroflexus aurantiacus]
MKRFLSVLPNDVKRPLRNARDFVIRVKNLMLYQGKNHFCPVCQKSLRAFAPYGRSRRKGALCIYCGSLERHRLLWLYLTQKTDLFDGRPKDVLHIAPEPCFKPIFHQKLGSGYITADLNDDHVMVKMDITNIQYPDASFDVILCSHVLEHVPDDRKAMREFWRVLKPTGWAILLVPIMAEVTFEDPSIVDPQARFIAFGQEDHVRVYGRDFPDRLRGAGFTVQTTTVTDLVPDPEAAVQMGLTKDSGEIYFCTKLPG